MKNEPVGSIVPTLGRLLPVLALVTATAACDGGTSPEGEAGIRIQLTDAPTDQLDSARVWISQVYLQGDDDGDEETDDEGGRVVLFEASDETGPKSYDLLALRDGIVADLAAATIEPGSYAQLRLVVDSSRVYLAEGLQFQDGSTEASVMIPSGSASGIKVQLERDIDAEEGETTVVVVDFDVNDAFTIQTGGPDGDVIHVRLHPVLREWARNSEEGVTGG